MKPDPKYALGKLSLIEYELAIGPGDVRSRLITALDHIISVTTIDFPSNLQGEWEWVKTQLTQRKGDFDQSNLQVNVYAHSISRMRNKKASELAKRIIYLKKELEDWLDDK